MTEKIDLERLRLKPEQLREARREPTDRMLQWFTYGHLPEPLAKASLPFCQLAEHVVQTFPMSTERTVCLRKLLEAKDAAVRCVLEGPALR